MYETFYRSKLKELAGKEFTSVEALEKAEAEVSEKEAKKQKAVEKRKSKAEVVKQAIVERVQAQSAAAEAKKKAYKEYLAACDAVDKLVEEKKAAESEQLKKFCAEYGAFHDSITIGDATYNVSYSDVVPKLNNLDPFMRLFSSWF